MLPSGSFRLWTTLPRIHRVDVFRPGIVNRRVVLGGQKMRLSFNSACSSARVDEAVDDERHHHVRKNHDVPQWERWQRFVDFQRCLHVNQLLIAEC